MKKNLAALLCTVLCVSALSGCGSGDTDSEVQSGQTQSREGQSEALPEEDSNVTPVGQYPVVEEPVTLKIMGRKDPGAPNWDELELFKRLTEITNIRFEFEMLESSVFPEQ